MDCGVFVVVSSDDYANRSSSKQTFSELESALRFGKNFAVIGKTTNVGLAVSLRRRLTGASGMGLKFFDEVKGEGEELDKLQGFFYSLGVRGGYEAEGEEGGGGESVSKWDSSVFSDDASQEGGLQMGESVRSWLANNGLAR